VYAVNIPIFHETAMASAAVNNNSPFFFLKKLFFIIAVKHLLPVYVGASCNILSQHGAVRHCNLPLSP